MLLNSIDAVVTRGDLADRAIVLTLEAIPDTHRKRESVLWADFERARPHILAALLDAMVVGLNRLEEVRLDELPRMADFAEWAVACEPGMFDEGAFLRAYALNRKGAVTTVMDASPVASAICDLMRKRRGQVWEGTATELYRELTGPVDKRVMKTPGWPVNAPNAEPVSEHRHLGAAAGRDHGRPTEERPAFDLAIRLTGRETLKGVPMRAGRWWRDTCTHP